MEEKKNGDAFVCFACQTPNESGPVCELCGAPKPGTPHPVVAPPAPESSEIPVVDDEFAAAISEAVRASLPEFRAAFVAMRDEIAAELRAEIAAELNVLRAAIVPPAPPQVADVPPPAAETSPAPVEPG